MSHLMNNYGRLPVSFDHGQGVWLWDKEGHKYLDALAGIAVNSVGHAHPETGPSHCRPGFQAHPLLQLLQHRPSGTSR